MHSRHGAASRFRGEFPADSTKRWAYLAWLLFIVVFAAAHFVHLSADFPNHSPWIADWAKYTDEGWYGNAAVRAHLLGHWRIPGDFNPGPALPVWPSLEWLLFFATGVSISAVRALAVSFFCFDVALAYLLVRAHAPRWAALLAVTLAVTSPFLYAFSRLAILEPALIAFTLAALNLAVRLPHLRRPVPAAALVGLLCTIAVLTKTSAVFLLPAIAWAVITHLGRNRTLAIRCALAAGGTAALSMGVWMGIVFRAGLLPDFKYLFLINTYPKPGEWYWPLLSLWASLRGAFWAGRILVVAAAIIALATLVFFRARWSRGLRSNAAFGASVLGALGYVLFVAYQNNPQPRYYTAVAIFACVIVGLGAHPLLTDVTEPGSPAIPFAESPPPVRLSARILPGLVLLVAAAAAIVNNAAWTVSYVMHPEYTFINAARQLARYVDQHPNGNRLLLSNSGDELTLITHLPALCDEFGTAALQEKIDRYQPGWWATWNDIDPAILEQIHMHDSLEQVASFRALDHPERNVLVLFKLHPLPNGQVRDPDEQNLQIPLPGDRIAIPIQ